MSTKFQIWIVLLCGLLPFISAAQTADKTLSPYFFIQSEGEQTEQLPLLATSAEVEISGAIADVIVRQQYTNRGQTPLEAIYVFPASTRAAVYDLSMQIGDRTVQAKIREKGQARQEYTRAKENGQRASLLEQERTNVFKMNVANLMPGDTIEVTLRYTELIKPEKGVYEFVYPTVVGPRYASQKVLAAANGQDRTAIPYQKEKEAPTYDFDFSCYLSSGVPIQELNVATHQVMIDYEDVSHAFVELSPSEIIGGNRDLVLRYRLAGRQLASGLLLYEGEDENHFLLTVQPPKRVASAEIPPREYVFIVDVSGSMNGWPLNISKPLLRNLISGLRPSDKFNVLLFAGTSGWLAEESLYANVENIEKAVRLIDRQRGGGGTELLPALRKAMALPRCEDNLSRSLIVVTDGYVNVESEAFRLISERLDEANLFAFGIGSSVNRELIEGMARAGQGEPLIVLNPANAAAQVEAFREYIQTPVLTQIQADFDGLEVYDLAQKSIPDVMAERPIVIHGKYRGAAKGRIRISGQTGSGTFTKDFMVADHRPSRRHQGLRYLWAREQVASLMDLNRVDHSTERIQAITQLGLRYNLLTPYTSFVAIDHEQVRKPTDKLAKQNQPLPLPAGVSNLAVGLEAKIEGGQQTDQVFASSNTRVMSQWKQLDKAVSTHQLKVRESITFILGKDRDSLNPYLAEAKKFYTHHAARRTEYLVDSCQSLQAVQEYIRQHRPANGLPWGEINFVVHSNAWNGMGVMAEHDGPRATRHTILEAVQNGYLKPLAADLIDAYSQLTIYGCGTGQNQGLMDALRASFGHHLQVSASPDFVTYQSELLPDGSVATERTFNQPFYAFFKSAESVNKDALIRQMETRYPDAEIHWSTVISDQAEALPEGFHRVQFRLPVVWTVFYDDRRDRPDIHTPKLRANWLAAQEALQEQLDVYGIPEDQFEWTIRKVLIKDKNGRQQAAIKAIGFCQVVCLLKTK